MPVRIIQDFSQAQAEHEAKEKQAEAMDDAEEEQVFQALLQSPTAASDSLQLPETPEEEEQQLQAVLVASRSSSYD